MNVETFKELRNSPELLELSNEISNLISLLSNNKKNFKNISKSNNHILKNPKMQLLKDKIENKVNLILNKVSELNFTNLLTEFIESLGKINNEDYITIQKTFYIKMQTDINFIKIYLEFFKVVSKIYDSVFNFKPDFFYKLIEYKFNFDYKNKNYDDNFTFLQDYNEENKRINHLIIIKTLINLNMLTNIKNDINMLMLEQDNHYADIYYWFQNETVSEDYKKIIQNKILNNLLPLREKVLLDNLISDKVEEPPKKEIKTTTKKPVKNIEVDTLKLESQNIIEEYLSMEILDDVKDFIEDKCKDALSKNKFCQYAFDKYFEGNIDISNKIIDLIKLLVKKQILFKSNLSRGILLINNNWSELSLDYNNPKKKMKDLLTCLKNMGITKFLESLLKDYKIEFVDSI
jgi:hypothetical protein